MEEEVVEVVVMVGMEVVVAMVAEVVETLEAIEVPVSDVDEVMVEELVEVTVTVGAGQEGSSELALDGGPAEFTTLNAVEPGATPLPAARPDGKDKATIGFEATCKKLDCIVPTWPSTLPSEYCMR